MKIHSKIKSVILFILISLLASCGGGGSTTIPPEKVSIEAELLGKSLSKVDSNGATSYLYLKEDHKFYGYGTSKELGYITYGDINNGTWSVDNKILKLDFNDAKVWTLNVNLEQMEAIFTDNKNTDPINKIVTTPADLIKRVNNDYYNTVKITEKELTALSGWAIVNRTDAYNISVSYLKNKTIYRPVNSTINDLGFVDGDSWHLSQDGRKIIHSRVTHELIKKEGHCYITRSTLAGDKSWVKTYNMCGAVPTNNNKASFERSEVEGNTVEYNSTAHFSLKPTLKPSHNVSINLSSTDTSQGIVEPEQLIFTPDNWDIPQTVTLRGQNKNPVDDKQNYQIVLSPAQSEDSRYSGIDLKDIDIKGVELKVSASKNLKPVFAGIDNTIYLNTQYNGGKSNYYQLTTDIANMRIEPFSGVIHYQPDESMEGSSVDVYLSMTDGRQTTDTHFKVKIAKTTPAKTEIREGNLVITDNGNDIVFSNKDGLSGELSVAKVKESDLPELPEGVIRLSDFYLIRGDKNTLGESLFDIKIKKLPQLKNKNVNILSLSIYSTNNINWNKNELYFQDIPESNPLFYRNSYNIIFYIGANKDSKKRTFRPKYDSKNKIETINKCEKTSASILNIIIGLKKCKSVINEKTLTIEYHDGLLEDEEFINISNKIIEILGYELEKFKYPNFDKFVFTIRDSNDNTGSVEKYVKNTVYIKLVKQYISDKYMATVIHHELFHVYQRGKGIGGWTEKNSWFIEGTAEWYTNKNIDKKLMLNDFYIWGYNRENLSKNWKKGGNTFKKILEEVGFIHTDGKKNKSKLTKKIKNSSWYDFIFSTKNKKAYKLKSSAYQTFAIWELIQRQCNIGVKDNIANLNVKTPASLSTSLEGMDCNFYNLVESDKNNTLASLLAYYQYASIKRGAGYFFGKPAEKGLDGNYEIQEQYEILCSENGTSETCKFAFDQFLSELSTANRSLEIKSIPSTGAKSFKVKDDNNKTQAKLEFDGFSKQLAVSIISDQEFCYRDNKTKTEEELEEETICSLENFTKAKEIETLDNKKVYKTSFFIGSNNKYDFTYASTKESKGRLPELFVTIVNTSNSSSDINNDFGSRANRKYARSTLDENSNPISNKKQSVKFIYGTGKINATVNYNKDTLHPTKNVFISVTRLTSLSEDQIDHLANLSDEEKNDLLNGKGVDIGEINQGAVVAEMEIDTSNTSSRFIHLFDNLEAGKYGLFIYPEDKTFIYDYEPVEVFANQTSNVELEFDMKYQPQTSGFSGITDKWEITDEDTGDISIVEFLSGGEIKNISGHAYVFHDTEEWSINAKGQLETRYYFVNTFTDPETKTLLTTMTHKIIGSKDDCKLINTTHSHSGLNKNSKMCRYTEEN